MLPPYTVYRFVNLISYMVPSRHMPSLVILMRGPELYEIAANQLCTIREDEGSRVSLSSFFQFVKEMLIHLAI